MWQDILQSQNTVELDDYSEKGRDDFHKYEVPPRALWTPAKSFMEFNKMKPLRKIGEQVVSEDPEKLANQDANIHLRLTLNFWKPGKRGDQGMLIPNPWDHITKTYGTDKEIRHGP